MYTQYLNLLNNEPFNDTKVKTVPRKQWKGKFNDINVNGLK